MVLVAGVTLALVTGCTSGGSNKAGGSRAPKPTVLTMADWSGPGEADAFAKAVTRLSHGRLRVVTHYGWRTGRKAQGSELIADVRAARADLGLAAARAFDAAGVTTFRGLLAPLLVNSYALQLRVLRSRHAARMLAGTGRIGLVGLGLLPGPIRHPVGFERPLLAPRDWAGLAIGTQESRVAEATLRELGARPVLLADHGSSAGLDGIEQELETTNDWTKIGYVTANVGLWPRTNVLFANGRRFASLTGEQRDILRQAAHEAIGGAAAYDRGWRRNLIANLCGEGIRFVVAAAGDLAAWRRAVQPVYDQLGRDPATRSLIDEIVALRGQGAPDPLPRCAPVARARTHAPVETSRVDGVYELVVGANDVAHELANASRALNPTLSSEGQERFTLTLDLAAGRWRLAQHPDGWTLTGTYRLSGDTLSLTPDGMTRPAWSLSWSTYRDRLRLAPLAGTTAPYWTSVGLWRRLGPGVPVRDPRSREEPPPNGVYRWSESTAGLVVAGDNAPEALNNGGRKLLILHNGHYTIRWLDQGNRTDVGIYRVAGNRIAFRFIGDRHQWLAARWTQADGELRFTDIVSPEGLFLAVFMGGKPWIRVG
jgi:TRAP-type C4-dicarboxylate transport system substrate-binding protein